MPPRTPKRKAAPSPIQTTRVTAQAEQLGVANPYALDGREARTSARPISPGALAPNAPSLESRQRRPPTLLFGAPPVAATTTVVASTGLSLAGGLPSSPSPYLLRSPDTATDYFSRMSGPGGENRSPLPSPLSVGFPLRRTLSADEAETQGGRVSDRERRRSNGSVSTASSSSPPFGATSMGTDHTPGRGSLRDEPFDTDSGATTPQPPASVVSPSVSGTTTPASRISAPSQPNSTFSDRSVRSSSVDVDVGIAFPSSASSKRGGAKARLHQPTVIRSNSGRGLMFLPPPTEAAPVSASPRPASFAGSRSALGVGDTRSRTSMPASASRASSSLAGVLAHAGVSKTPIPDKLEAASPPKHTHTQSSSSTSWMRRRNSNHSAHSVGAASTSTSGSDGSTPPLGTPTPGVPRRTGSASSLRARLMSSRPAPEALVTTTSVSTSLTGGQHKQTEHTAHLRHERHDPPHTAHGGASLTTLPETNEIRERQHIDVPEATPERPITSCVGTQSPIKPTSEGEVNAVEREREVRAAAGSVAHNPSQPLPSSQSLAPPTPLSPPAFDMNTMHAGPFTLIDNHPLAPHVTVRARGKKPASWNARSDSEGEPGETELHEVNNAQTVTVDGGSTHSPGSTIASGCESTDSGYTPTYAVRRRKSTSKIASQQANHVDKDPEAFTLTLAASLASQLPLPFDRRRIELIVTWSTPTGVWRYVPLAKYLPSWGVVVGGPVARLGDSDVQRAFEIRGLVRDFLGCIPLVGRFAAWL